MTEDQQLELFMTLFRGRADVYARHWEKDGRSGYAPAYEFNWTEFMEFKRRGGTLKDFENKRLIPLTEDVIRGHLVGQHVIGVYPILQDNTSHFLAADFDGENWKEESRAFIDQCSAIGLSAYLERSRSGNGGHVWIFFSEPYPCYKSRQIGLEIIRRIRNVSEFEKEVSFDRLFPNQDSLTKNGFGNLIALPFQSKAVRKGNTVFIDLTTDKAFSDQWEYLSEIRRHLAVELDEVYNALFSEERKEFHETKRSGKLNILVSNKIVMPRSGLVPELIHFLKEELNFINTEYLTKRRLGKSVYQVEKYFKLVEESGDNIFLPRGFLHVLTDFLEEHRIKYSVRFEHPVVEETLFKSSIELTLPQISTIQDVMPHDQGVIVAPSGSGKTIIGLELIARKKLPALILVHRKQLLDQWVERIQAFLGIAKTHIGQYSSGKKKVGKQITVGLLQSLGRKKDLSDMKNQFGTIIVDECHHIPASTFREVISQLNPKYIYGLTATPQRKHNDEKLIYAFIGDIISRMEMSDFVSIVPSVEVVIEIIIRTTTLSIPFKFTTDQFQLLAKIICFDTTRNRMIVDDIFKQVELGKQVLVLSERKDHLEILNLYLKGKLETIIISGNDSAASRTSKIKQIEGGHYKVILSTGQFFGEGLDIKGINCLILAFPFSFEGKLLQYIGRMRGRGVQKTIVDYRDKEILFLERQYKQRERYYKKIEAEIRHLDLPLLQE
ncbi:MAG: DEAD/DEAH box helicase family protein [Candidatus Paceibacterota bacterium]|jgi:superfamily II DNA or RNA helicase